MTLSTLLLQNPHRRQALEVALVQLVENEIAAKQGVEGNLIKSTHASAKKLIPGILPRGITLTLPDLVADFDVEYALAQQRGMTFTQHLLDPARTPFLTRSILRAFQQVVAQYPLLVPLFHLIKSRIEYHAALAIPHLVQVLQSFCT